MLETAVSTVISTKNKVVIGAARKPANAKVVTNHSAKLPNGGTDLPKKERLQSLPPKSKKFQSSLLRNPRTTPPINVLPKSVLMPANQSTLGTA
jgi:hypothetical protein